MRTVKVRDLKPGDKVDMENVHPDYHDELAEFEYGVVDSVEAETPDCYVVHFENLSSCELPPGKELQVDSCLIEYQNADYRSIYTHAIDVPGIGECWLILFVEPTNENDSSRPEDETWTALFLVSTCLETADTIKDCLEATVGYKGQPTPEEAAVGLAEFGKRTILWEKVSKEGEADLEAVQAEAARLLANPELLSGYVKPKCSVCGEQSDTRLDARVLHAAGIHPTVKYCRHCGQYPASIMRSKP